VDERQADLAVHPGQRLAHAVGVPELEIAMQHHATSEAQGGLEAALARYADLYEWAPVAHLAVDAFGTVRKVNQACAALLGRDPVLIEGVPVRVLLDQDSQLHFDAHLRASLSSREARTVELAIRLPNGQKRPVEMVTVPRPPTRGGGDAIVFHSALIDVSERRRADERRDELLRREREARLLADSANQVKEDFLAIAAHELRTPLAPLLLWVRALRLGGGDPGMRERALAAIENGIKTHLAMIDDLITVQRGRRGDLRVELNPVDVRSLVTVAVEALAPAAAAKRISVEATIPAEPACVAGDFARLRQVLNNLLSNAIKFTPEGGNIAVALSLAGDEVALAISDDGEGLEAELLEEVFEPFRQRDKTAARHHGGLGLGLAIVREIVAEHGGAVRAESAGRGQGCTFKVRLPRIEATEALPKMEGATSIDAAKDAGVLRGLRVLVVEDHADTRDALAVILEACGAKVLTAAAATDAWSQVFGSRRPDVIVSDIGLPGEDGCALIRRVRTQELANGDRRLVAIALTALAAPRDRARALLAGFDRHVAKPIAFDQLIATISSLLQGGSGPAAQPRPRS
jgi:PAS domain S-box-containing protein